MPFAGRSFRSMPPGQARINHQDLADDVNAAAGVENSVHTVHAERPARRCTTQAPEIP
jgi:hypothetical protein